jgi:hypothetical protein
MMDHQCIRTAQETTGNLWVNYVGAVHVEQLGVAAEVERNGRRLQQIHLEPLAHLTQRGVAVDLFITIVQACSDDGSRLAFEKVEERFLGTDPSGGAPVQGVLERRANAECGTASQEHMAGLISKRRVEKHEHIDTNLSGYSVDANRIASLAITFS